MRDWMAYLITNVNSPVWGFAMLDYYHSEWAKQHGEGPSRFLQDTLGALPIDEVEPVSFHNVLLSVCVQLLGTDFSDIMDTSIKFLRRLSRCLDIEEINAILLQYSEYGMREAFDDKIRSSDVKVESEVTEHSLSTENLEDKSKHEQLAKKTKPLAATQVGSKPTLAAISNSYDLTDIRSKIEFGIITVREDEFTAVLQRFKPTYHTWGLRRYEVCTTTVGDRNQYCAIVRLPAQGPGRGQQVTRDLIEDLNPKWIVLVGICGAVPSADYTLGDVVCATRVNDFSVSAVTQASQEFDVQGGPMEPYVEGILASLPAINRQLIGWDTLESIGIAKPRLRTPVISSDKYYGDSKWKQKVKQSLQHHFTGERANRGPLVTSHSIASSGALVKNAALIKQWLGFARSVAAVEMELAGAYLAARRPGHEYPVLAIRGISDIVGFKRDDDWTKYACHTAASFAYHLIASGAGFPTAV